MATVAQSKVKELIQTRKNIRELQDNLTEMESDLIGMEFKYNNDFAVVEHIDTMEGNVILYIEDDDGDSWNEAISLYELIDILG